jgi:hypothetical protein
VKDIGDIDQRIALKIVYPSTQMLSWWSLFMAKNLTSVPREANGQRSVFSNGQKLYVGWKNSVEKDHTVILPHAHACYSCEVSEICRIEADIKTESQF